MRSNEDLYRMISEAVPHCVLVAGLDGRFEWVSPSVHEVLGWDRDQMIGLRSVDVVHPDDDRRVATGRDSDTHGAPLLDECRVRCADGTYRWMSAHFQEIGAVIGDNRRRVISLVDAEEVVAARRALEESEFLYRLLVENSADVVFRGDAAANLSWVSPSVVKLTGWEPAELVGRPLSELVDPVDHAALNDAVNAVLAGDPTEFVGRLVTRDAALRWVSVAVNPLVVDGEVIGSVGNVRDVTVEIEARDALVALATHDTLTGLANRATMLDELRRALAASTRSGRPTGLVMLDLDHFKAVNDTLGHSVGDSLLRLAASRLASTVRNGDLVARLGGDEFAVVMRDLDSTDEAIKAGGRIVDAFRAPFRPAGNEMHATASVGIAVASSAVGADDLIVEADTALYRAKSEGRDRVSIFNAEARARLGARNDLEAQLRHALPNGELELWYQPEINLDTGTVVAVEALLRWHHPSGELYPAAKFIDVATDTGLILDIGHWGISQAANQAVAWAARAGRPIVVRVNLSDVQLAEPGLIAELDSAIEDSGVDPSLLCVEFAEGALLHQAAAVNDNMAALRTRTVRVAVDDFGTGFGAVSYLRDFAFDTVKVDRSFTIGIDTDEPQRAFVAGLISLAGHLGLSVTAEGVETSGQARVLRELGCAAGQGYLYSAPMPAAEIDAVLDRVFPHE